MRPTAPAMGVHSSSIICNIRAIVIQRRRRSVSCQAFLLPTNVYQTHSFGLAYGSLHHAKVSRPRCMCQMASKDHACDKLWFKAGQQEEELTGHPP